MEESYVYVLLMAGVLTLLPLPEVLLVCLEQETYLRKKRPIKERGKREK